VELPLWTVRAGIALWSVGALGFIRPVWYGIQILLTGGVVLSLLYIYDGTIILLSKMCTYCLLLSIVWVLEPLWDPHKRKVATTTVLEAELMEGQRNDRPTNAFVVSE
jgi:uncharacterized membrane protein